MAKLAQLVPAWDAGGRAQLVPAFREQATAAFSSPADRGTLNIGASSYSGGVYTFKVRWDNTSNSTGGRFLYALLTGVNGATPTVRVERSNFGITLNNAWRFVYSYDGINWLQMANRSSDATYYIASHSAPFAADQVYVALFPPWQTGRTLPFIQSLEGTGYVGETPSTSGYVFNTRTAAVNEAGAVISATPLYAFKISTPGVAPDGAAKRNMVLISGVHASEDIGNYALKGAIEFLVSEEPQAAVLRSWFNVFVYPVVASAGRKGGGTRGDYQSGFMTTDINRQWLTSNFETLVKHKTAILADTGGAAAVFIDFHGTVAQSSNYDFYETGNDVAAWTAAIRTYIPGLTQLAQDDSGTSSEWAMSALAPDFAIISEHAIGSSNVLQATVEANGASHMRAVALLASQNYFGIDQTVEGSLNAIDDGMDTAEITGFTEIAYIGSLAAVETDSDTASITGYWDGGPVTGGAAGHIRVPADVPGRSRSPGVYGRFSKQSGEVLDYVVDFTDWFSNRTDGPSFITPVAETGITIEAMSLVGPVARVVVAGGVHGGKYKVTVSLTTDASPVPIRKEVDFIIEVKDV